MQFILRGFKEVMGFRVFAFDGVQADRKREIFTIKANLGLARQYGIRLQELPLLCRAALERGFETQDKRAFTYSEEDMRLHADSLAAREAVRHKRTPRRPVSEQVGNAWRGPQK
ncbi:MAG: hypothetical protein FJW20_16725 [Acidimicrobiia bacterium]|nr:hypothetical protein [Acidimicrobiia bacterium]